MKNVTLPTTHTATATPTTPSKFRLSTTISVNFTPALHAQLMRYAQSIGATRSKAIKRLIAAYCEAPKLASKPRATTILPEPKRDVAVTWSLSDKEARAHLESLAKINKVTTSTLVRRIIYTNTKPFMSPNPEEQTEAAADAWV